MATQTAHPKVAAKMAEACNKFLDSLSPDQKKTATYRYMDGERVFWYYPPLNRHGLPLRDMNPTQRCLAYGILASALGEKAYSQATQIIDHEAILGPLEKEEGRVSFERDPSLYYFTVFGKPGGKDPWAWRAEGHHVSLHFSVWDDRIISMTPFFFGANPAEVRKGPKAGLRILGDSEDLALGLMEGMSASQRKRAIIFDKAPWDILTYNSTRASLPQEEGLPGSKMSGTQKETMMALITEYVSRVHSELAEQKLAALAEKGLDRMHFAWGGPVTKADAHYYRIHGGNFVVEFDNRQNGANHIHSVWRDVDNDFANDVLREHLILYHVI